MRGHLRYLTRRSALKKGVALAGAIGLGSVVTSGTASAGIGDGRVGHYPLNNLKGKGKEKTKVHDASPENNDGTAKGGVSVAKGDGRVGNAFEFDGNDDYVDLGDELTQAFSAMTVAAWIKNTADSGGYQAIVERNYWNADDGFGLFVDSNKKASWGHWGGGPTVTSSKKVGDGNWHHVAGTLEPDGDQYQYTIYVDGEADGSATIDRDVSSSDEPTGIGRRIADYAGDYYFDGLIDEVRLYDRALSDSEIASLAAMGGENGKDDDKGKGNGGPP